MTAYWGALRALPKIADLLEPRPGDSLKGIFQVLAPNQPLALVLYAATAVATLVITARIWRSDAPFEPRASAVVLATILVSAHVNAYDLVLLAPVLFLLATWLAQSGAHAQTNTFAWLLVALFLAPILVSLPPIVRLQFSVTAMAAVLVLMWRTVRLDVAAGLILSPTMPSS
jgi:hypothetical protein